MTLNEEIWKPVLYFEDYYDVSNFGNVRSKDRIVKDDYYRQGIRCKRQRIFKGRTMKFYKSGSGYKRINFKIAPRVFALDVHRLVLMTFKGDRSKEGLICNHKDSNKFNNHIDNLEWVTHSQNTRHMYENGIRPVGSMNHQAKLSEIDVFVIRKLYKEGSIYQWEIAECFNVEQTTISCIIRKKTWKHLPDDYKSLRSGLKITSLEDFI